VIALGGAAVAGGAILIGASGHGDQAARSPRPSVPSASPAPRPASTSGTDTVTAVRVAPLRRIVPPDLFVVSAPGISAGELAKIRKLSHVRDVITADGGAIRMQSGLANVLGVDPSTFRSWTPPPTAANQRIWSALARNEFVVSSATQARLRLVPGASYQMAGAAQALVPLGASAPLGLPGVDALVSPRTSRVLGLVPNVAAMINAPGANLRVLTSEVRAAVGPGSQILNLTATAGQLPVDSRTPAGRPTNYLDLYRQSAARYCPGLSWTILAAIGQIESGHGRNDGPSKAGALGPMQFLPSTWRIWGIPGFGDTTADIMNPYDAVPSAARYLCASGAAAGGTSLYNAIFAYNHADWYVREVLALAGEYAAQFG
jgi:hypothetical protein